MNWARKLIEPRHVRCECRHDRRGDCDGDRVSRCDNCGWETPADELEMYNGALLCYDCFDEAVKADNADGEDLDENNGEEADDDDNGF